MKRISFRHIKKQRVTITKTTPITVNELRAILHDHKPPEIWHPRWSSRQPFIYIAEYFDNGVFKWFCANDADKTPRAGTAQKLYDFLKYQGFEECYFQV